MLTRHVVQAVITASVNADVYLPQALTEHSRNIMDATEEGRNKEHKLTYARHNKPCEHTGYNCY